MTRDPDLEGRQIQLWSKVAFTVTGEEFRGVMGNKEPCFVLILEHRANAESSGSRWGKIGYSEAKHADRVQRCGGTLHPRRESARVMV